METDTPRPDVFVSYAAADRERVRPLVDALVGDGLNVWWDRQIAPGAGFDAEIQGALDRSRCVLVVWSNASAGSEWVINEASEGLERGILVPCAIDDVRPPLAFRRRQTIDATHGRSARSDVLDAVRAVLDGVPVELPTHGHRPNRRSPSAPWMVGALVIGLILGALAVRLISTTDVEPRPLAAELNLEGWVGPLNTLSPAITMALSPTGEMLVYVARDDARRNVLRTRRLDEVRVRQLPGSIGAEAPFFSPDGAWIGYFDDGALKRVPVSGGEPVTILQDIDGQFWGATWGDDGRIVFAAGGSGLSSVTASGTDLRPLTELDNSRNEGVHRTASYVPGYRRLLYSVQIEPGVKHEIWALDLDTGKSTYLLDGIRPTYIPSGELIFAKGERGGFSGGSLWRVPFDPETLEIRGEPVVLESATGGREGGTYVAGGNVLVYLPSLGDTYSELRLLEAGKTPLVISSAAGMEGPVFSNAGTSAAVTEVVARGKLPVLKVYDLTSGSARQIATNAYFPLWDPDDTALTFMEAGTGLVHQTLEGRQTVLVDSAGFVVPLAWVENGSKLLYWNEGDMALLGADGTSQSLPWGDGMATPSVSGDEQWVALCRWANGPVYVGPYPDLGSVTVATTVGCTPKWSADATRLYFQDLDSLWVMPARVSSNGIVFGERELVAELGVWSRKAYDVDARGRMLVTYNGFPDARPPVLVVNWQNRER